MTEALIAGAIGPVRGQGKPGAVGLPLPDVEMKIVDAETARELPDGHVGEILIRAPQVMPGYWNAPEETADALRLRGDGGAPWLHTGAAEIHGGQGAAARARGAGPRDRGRLTRDGLGSRRRKEAR